VSQPQPVGHRGESPKRLLVVDDELTLTELLKRYLERLGYQVDACTSPEGALKLFGEQPSAYSLLVTDLTLPGINGEELVTQLRQMNPRLQAVISSGYPYQPVSRDVEFLQKPFLPKNLAELLERMLRAPRS